MKIAGWVLLALSLIAMIVAVIGAFGSGNIVKFGPTSWWRLSTILALWALVVTVLGSGRNSLPGS